MSIARRLPLLLSTLCCVALATSVAGAGEPRGGARSGSAHREVTRTGPNGNSQTWQRDTTWQRGGGQYDRHTTQTGPKGATRSKDVHVERTDGGRASTTTVTRRDGSTVQYQKTVSRSAPAPGSAAE